MDPEPPDSSTVPADVVLSPQFQTDVCVSKVSWSVNEACTLMGTPIKTGPVTPVIGPTTGGVVGHDGEREVGWIERGGQDLEMPQSEPRVGEAAGRRPVGQYLKAVADVRDINVDGGDIERSAQGCGAADGEAIVLRPRDRAPKLNVQAARRGLRETSDHREEAAVPTPPGMIAPALESGPSIVPEPDRVPPLIVKVLASISPPLRIVDPDDCV